MSRHFGNFSRINKETEEKIHIIEGILSEVNIDYDLYSGYPIINENLKKEFVKAIFITKKCLLVLFENDEEQVKFASSLMHHLSADSSLFTIASNFKEYVKLINLRDDIYKIISDLTLLGDRLSDIDIKKINRAIQKSFNLTSTDNRTITKDNSLGSIIKERNTYISSYDVDQFNMVLNEVQKHQRVRGLAGSGKTILLLKKLAYLHFLERKTKMCFVFYTTSLRLSMVTLFKNFYKEYEPYKEPDFDNVKIFHAWGGKGRRGFYSDLCELTDKEYLNYSEAIDYDSEGEPFEVVSEKLLNELKIDSSYMGTYDYVFIDEAQDFGINFFHLALKSLKNNGKIIYAYDELQSLKDELSIPSKKEIFGSDLDCEDINLSISYRAPLEILTTAHALGMGIYRTVAEGATPIVNLVDNNTLLDMGYENLTEEFIPNHLVDLKRKHEQESGIIVDAPKAYSNALDQYCCLAKDIISLIKSEDVLPEDIMIIDLNSGQLTKNHEKFSEQFEQLLALNKMDETYHVRLVSSKTPSMKKEKGAINYTSVFRAKGNEANLVFVINCNRLTQLANGTYRNEIFTAMTRAKVKVWLYGTNVGFLSNEIEEVKVNNYHLIFNYPTEEQKRSIRLMGDEEEKIETKVEAAEGLSVEILEAILAQKRAEQSVE
ncbi:ATP-binding domain-containing protein [Streptococcus sp. FSL W7-1342]|uniref:DEAD/DEAH box helicase n=1 Tax=Streptococcus sp. FSL W7-1342 TaxID=2954545 RepID=UPI0030D919AC